jgi:wyosine [tRNA(Phe)-imidazoG37] synthetase (radical SAM superfamily)
MYTVGILFPSYRGSDNIRIMGNYIFGPVPSRRLGFSLGVDIIPSKVCTFDCLYCQIGKTTKLIVQLERYFDPKEVAEAVALAVSKTEVVDFVTFSGSGEPTLNANLGLMIEETKKRLSLPVAVITNGSLLYMEDVRRDLTEADVVLPSLDAVSDDIFRYINRPHSSLKLDIIIEGLRTFRKEFRGQIWLEIMLIKGLNDDDEELLKMKLAAESIEADKIQLNTVVRPPMEETGAGFDPEELERICEIFGPRAEIIGSFQKYVTRAASPGWEEAILSILERRSLSLEDVIRISGVPFSEATRQLKRLERSGLIRSFHFGEGKYFIREK